MRKVAIPWAMYTQRNACMRVRRTACFAHGKSFIYQLEDATSAASYLCLQMDIQSSHLEASAAYLVYVKGKPRPVRAGTIGVGEHLLRTTKGGSTDVARATKIERVARKGAYMPLTKDGPLVMDRLLVSSNVSIQEDAPAVVDQYLNDSIDSQKTTNSTGCWLPILQAVRERLQR